MTGDWNEIERAATPSVLVDRRSSDIRGRKSEISDVLVILCTDLRVAGHREPRLRRRMRDGDPTTRRWTDSRRDAAIGKKRKEKERKG